MPASFGASPELSSDISRLFPTVFKETSSSLLDGQENIADTGNTPSLADVKHELIVSQVVDFSGTQTTPLSKSRLEFASYQGSRSKLKLREERDLLKNEATRKMNEIRVPSSWLPILHPGSRFEGEQRCGRTTYSVEVTIQDVDLKESFLCGYLKIRGLTDDYPELTTYFDAEIIGSKHSFLTRKWDADENIDLQHWTKFDAFQGLEMVFNKDDFDYDFSNKNHLFMRWKEHFLVPDHNVQSIPGASFAGFYYTCIDLSTGNITGFYYHQNSEWFQYISLKHVPLQSIGAFEFR